MARDIVLVSFDFPKSDYDSRSYSISSILASLKKHGVSASHYCININQVSEERLLKGKEDWYISIDDCMHEKIDAAIDYLVKFKFIAIGVARWSKDYAKYLVDKLRKSGFQGKIICGSYEITATDDKDLVKKFGDADYFIKGYAEKPLVKLINDKCCSSKKVIFEDLDSEYLASPYQEGIIPLYSRKIYWETKRGCKFSCGFCEWGNREHKDAIDIDEEVLRKDIELFSKSNIDEINILDGTFNIGNCYLDYLKDLLKKTDCKITFQARFEVVNDEFLNLCEENNDRVHLEFGLQTIHKNEMKQIGRKNLMKKVRCCMKELNKRQISYEVSIIYAIPGQTIDSFIDTIEFLKINGCKKIRAFPLQIPNNYKNKDSVGELQADIYNVESVANSCSFTKFDRGCMDIIAEHLNGTSELKPVIGTIGKDRWKAIIAAYEIYEYIGKEGYKGMSQTDLDSANERLKSKKYKIDITWIVNCWRKDCNFAKSVIALLYKNIEFKLPELTRDEVNRNPDVVLEHSKVALVLMEYQLNIILLPNSIYMKYNLDQYVRLVHLMKMIDFHKMNNKISLCEDRKYVYRIDNEVLKEYERDYIELLYSDYVTQYSPISEEVKDMDYKHIRITKGFNDNPYDEMIIPALKLHKHIEEHIPDIEYKSIGLSPVIRIGVSGDFYVYAKVRYFINGEECTHSIFRFCPLKDWEKNIRDKFYKLNLLHYDSGTGTNNQPY